MSSKNLSWYFGVMAMFLIVVVLIMSYTSGNEIKKNKYEINKLNKKIHSIILSTDQSEERLNFLQFADSVIANSPNSSLDLADRAIFTNSLWEGYKRFNIDPYLLLAVSYIESGFNQKAVSNKGAKGIMQFMPSTFKLCASLLREDYKDDDIFDVSRQGLYAAFYLRLLADDCQDMDLALSRYNAGHIAKVTSYARAVNAQRNSYVEPEF